MNELIAIEKIAQWEKLKQLVLDSVSSPITKRVYNMALDEFMEWFQQGLRPGFTKATVSAWRVSLEERGLGSSSIIIRMSAIHKLAAVRKPCFPHTWTAGKSPNLGGWHPQKPLRNYNNLDWTATTRQNDGGTRPFLMGDRISGVGIGS